MARSVALKITAEREKQGLIIISAQYGLASAFTDRGVRATRTRKPDTGRETGEQNGHTIEEVEEEEVVVDVTVPVQGLVVDSKLYIPGGRGKVSSLITCKSQCARD